MNAIHLPLIIPEWEGEGGEEGEEGEGCTDLRVHLYQVEEDNVLALHLDGLVEWELRFGLDHLVEELGAHGAEVLLPQVVLGDRKHTLLFINRTILAVRAPCSSHRDQKEPL